MASSAEIAEMYIKNKTGIRVGMIFAMLAFGLIVPWALAIVEQTKLAAPEHPILAQIQVVCCGLSTFVGIMFAMVGSLASFRPDVLNPETTRLLNDFLWFWWLLPWPPFALWGIAIGVSIFLDRRTQPIYPRWAAYMTLWLVLCYIPGVLCLFFKSGPMAFNGLISWYIPTIAFFAWAVIMTKLTFSAVKRMANLEMD
ncbi:MAG: hypothetical protein M0Q95_15830 [Porticoccaceae bacterium]|nr:hypothetical protein [Porticoccaceae bacterium]